MNLHDYVDSWIKFEEYCRNKVKNKCTINSSGWKKLQEYHLSTYLSSLDNPFLFLFTMKWKYKPVFDSHKMLRYYRYYSNKMFNSTNQFTENIIQYGSNKKEVVNDSEG